ncbi:MAG: hypothetical protein V7643_5056 [Mycobacterium sp.]|jgi:hypothetical protein
MTTDAATRATLADTDNAVSQLLVDGADGVVLGAFTQTIRTIGRRFSTPVALHVDDRLVTWLRVHEDSHAVSGAYAGHPCVAPGRRARRRWEWSR